MGGRKCEGKQLNYALHEVCFSFCEANLVPWLIIMLLNMICKKYSRALCASVPLLYWKIMGLYPIKNCIKSLKYDMHFTGISLIRLFCMCWCWQYTEGGSSDWLFHFKFLRIWMWTQGAAICTVYFPLGTFSSFHFNFIFYCNTVNAVLVARSHGHKLLETQTIV